MPYSNLDRQRLHRRGLDRTRRHGNWRQTYIDCGGQCIAQVNGSEYPCGKTEYLELHEVWGENQDNGKGKFQQRVLLCNLHHALVDDHCHQYTFIQGQYQLSQLTEDINLEILVVGGRIAWMEKYKLDDSRFGIYLYAGIVKVAEVIDENVVEIPTETY